MAGLIPMPGQPDAPLPTEEEMSAQLAGSWRIRSFELTNDPNSTARITTVNRPCGRRPLGSLVLSRDPPYLCCMLTSAEAAQPIPSPIYTTASDAEVLRVARPLLACMGRYELLRKEGGQGWLLKTSVDVAVDPNWMGTDQIQTIGLREEDGNLIMVLRPIQPFLLRSGSLFVARLEWEKITA
ncbi:uncharacterized protein PG986_012737 [Apiospora aurea]|uniref:Lipocalin-like domain-containing protein n=1 Tax=Apiospora aurea TaxID=335848 RepID=A0ABR1Q0V1_9PEZI